MFAVTLIGVYRDNEVGPSHPCTDVKTIRDAGANVQQIVLTPRARQRGQLLSIPTLWGEQARPLAQLIYENRGQSVLRDQFITALAKAYSLPIQAAAWDRIDAHQCGATDNVMTWPGARSLTRQNTESGKTVACLGNAAKTASLVIHGVGGHCTRHSGSVTRDLVRRLDTTRFYTIASGATVVPG